MSTKDKERKEKLVAARKKLRKFQSRQTQRSAVSKPETDLPLLLFAPHGVETNALLEGAPALASSLPTLSFDSLSLTTPTDTPLPVANGYITSGGWSPTTQPLTPPTNPHSVSGVQMDRLSLSHQLGDSQQQASEVVKWTDIGPPQDAQAQTIDILVAEKSSLQSEINSFQTQLRNRKREVEDLSGHLQATRDQLEQNERHTLSLSEEKSSLETALLEVGRAREEAETALEKMRATLEETRQENTELVSKVTSQAVELHSVQAKNSNLQSQLTMAELLTQQLSGSSPSSPEGLPGQLDELRGEVGRLETLVRSVSGERDQATSDLDALREAMIQQRQESAERLAGLHSRLAESEAERVDLSEQLSQLSQRLDELMQKSSSEHAQLQQSTQVAMETLQREKEQLQAQLQTQLRECEKVTERAHQLESQLEEAEREAERLRETAVDSRSLMDTMSQDKEALSRAVGQNQQLKSQLAELQDGFVRLSQQNMELASDLETERFCVTQLKREREREKEKEVVMVTSTEGAEGTEEMEVESRADDDKMQPMVEVATQTAVEEEVEDTSTSEQLKELERERDSLREEISRLNSELTNQSTAANERGSPTGNDAANQTMDILSAVQANFTALQERYVAVMSEKAELLEQVEERELTIGRLSGETETIGEYITLYQTQREALRAKFKEKDDFIQQLISEKQALQVQLGEVQRLMKQLVNERPHHITPSPSPTPPIPSSPSSLPLHLQQLSSHHHQAPPSPPRMSPDTVDQIFQLLSVMGDTGEGVKSDMVPCACCTGDVITL